jgi:hypothetical protein
MRHTALDPTEDYTRVRTSVKVGSHLNQERLEGGSQLHYLRSQVEILTAATSTSNTQQVQSEQNMLNE